MKNGCKVIFHIDMNAFFASVEEIKYPFLKGKPFAIGVRGSNRGVISTASYEARKYGVGSAKPQNEAIKKCPNLIILDSHFDMYNEYSMLFINLLKEYSNLVEQASIDEAYVDMTEACKTKNGIELAKEIQNRIKNELKLPCSIGIGPNLFLAKMASDYKKPMGITVIRYKDVENKIWPLKIGDMFGIGKKSVPRLNKLGITTIGDLANYSNKEELRNIFGDNFYNDVMNKAYGKGSDIVVVDRYATNQSIGNSRTFSDTNDEEELKKHLSNITKLVSDRLSRHGYIGKTITVQIRYKDFKTITRSKTLNKYIDLYEDLYFYANELFDINWNGDYVRLLGVTLSHVMEKEKFKNEYDIFDIDIIEKEQKRNDLKRNLKEKFGNIVK